MMELIKVIEVKPFEHPLLWLEFSNGYEGVRDLSDILAEGGGMIDPLRDPAMFGRFFVQCGVMAWPDGFDLDALALHDEMLKAGVLRAPQAA